MDIEGVINASMLSLPGIPVDNGNIQFMSQCSVKQEGDIAHKVVLDWNSGNVEARHAWADLALVSDSILQGLLEGQAVHPGKGGGLHQPGRYALCELPLTHLLESPTHLPQKPDICDCAAIVPHCCCLPCQKQGISCCALFLSCLKDNKFNFAIYIHADIYMYGDQCIYESRLLMQCSTESRQVRLKQQFIIWSVRCKLL